MKKRGFLAAAAAAALSVGVAGAAEPTQKASAFDRHFIMAAAQNDRFEIASATLARRVGQGEALCDFAERLARDHARSLSQLTALARTVRVNLPRTANPVQQWAVRFASTLPVRATGTTGTTTTGPTFEDVFTDLQAAAHRHAIVEFAHAARVAEHPRVRSFARAQLPTLRAHLKMVEELEEEEQPTLPGGCPDDGGS